MSEIDYYPYILTISPIIMNALNLFLKGEFSLDKFKLENSLIISSITTPIILYVVYKGILMIDPLFVYLKEFFFHTKTIYITDQQLLKKLMEFMKNNKYKNITDIMAVNGRLVEEPHFDIDNFYWTRYVYLGSPIWIAPCLVKPWNKDECKIGDNADKKFGFKIQGKSIIINLFYKTLFSDVSDLNAFLRKIQTVSLNVMNRLEKFKLNYPIQFFQLIVKITSIN